MFKRKRVKNAIFIAIPLTGLFLLWQAAYRGAITILIAGILTLTATAAFCVALAIKRPETGKTIVGAMGSAWTVCALAAQVVDLKEPLAWINDALKPLGVTLNEQTFLFATFFCFFAIFFGLFKAFGLFVNPTMMSVHSESGDPEFREKSFTEKSAVFREVLLQRVHNLDTKYLGVKWDERLFTPIEAEVEIVSWRRHKRRYGDLLRCLKKARRDNAVYLILGAPGSGKSVALRKLCADLMKEAEETGKTPVYINLKEWTQNWNPKRLPNKDELIRFVKERLLEGGDSFTNKFLNQYFERMLEDGRWYFLFDSFDEMPCLMGEENIQPIINHISKLLFEFLTGPGQSGGVIASRFYKAPSDALGATVTLRIQEFNDIKIKAMLKRYLGNAEGVVRALFGFDKREDLVSICRNPFHLSLLIAHILKRGIQFPKDQFTLYQEYFEDCLENCDAELKEKNVSREQLYEAAEKLASIMQGSTRYGLECPISVLYRQPEGREKWRIWMTLLTDAGLCRFGGSAETVSFVHRRFQEFFLVKDMMNNGRAFAYQSVIVNNAGSLRDTLTLYCEVADLPIAREIARFCWRTIRDNIRYKDSVLHDGAQVLTNTLHFMTEAFRNRKEAISDFQQAFEAFVTENLDESADFAVQIALIDSMALFEQDYLEKIVLRVFQLDNHWLKDEVMKNLRLMENLNPQIETEFTGYFHGMPIPSFLRQYGNTAFSLSIPKAFRYVRNVHRLTYWWYCVVAVLLVGLTAVSLLSTWKYGAASLSANLFFNVSAALRVGDEVFFLSNNSLPAHYSFALKCLLLSLWEMGWLFVLDIVYHFNRVSRVPRPERRVSKIAFAVLICVSGLLAADILFVSPAYSNLTVNIETSLSTRDVSEDAYVHITIPDNIDFNLSVPDDTSELYRVFLRAGVCFLPVLLDCYWIAHGLKGKKPKFKSVLLRTLILLLPLCYYVSINYVSSALTTLADLTMNPSVEIPLSAMPVYPREGSEGHITRISVYDELGNLILLTGYAPGSNPSHPTSETLSYLNVYTREEWEKVLEGVDPAWRDEAIRQYKNSWNLRKIYSIVPKIQRTFPRVMAGILALSAVYAALFALRYLWNWRRDRRLVRSQPLLNGLDRSDLQDIIERLNTDWWKRAYSGDLVLNRVSLFGEWHESGRPKGDSDMERNLAVLDCESIEGYNYRF